MQRAKGIYEQAKRDAQLQMRRTLIDLAGQLLATEGPDALAVRRIAEAAGCSTKVIYASFGSKSGLAEALYLEGFDRIRQRMEAVASEPDPAQRLRLYALENRAFALDSTEFYGLMFEKNIPGYEPSRVAIYKATQVFGFLLVAVQDCIDQGFFPPVDKAAVVRKLWATQHGYISLGLNGYLELGETRDEYLDLVDDVISAVRARA